MTAYDTLPARLIEAALILADRGDAPTARLLTRATARVLEHRAGYCFGPDADPVAVIATLAINGDAAAGATLEQLADR